MKQFLLLLFSLSCSLFLQAQSDYDSVTISRFIEKTAASGKGWTVTTHGNYSGDLVGERSIWINRGKSDSIPYIFSLTERIRDNGAKSVGRCFIPRHIISFYQSGKATRFILVCFQCNGFEFSDMPVGHAGLLVDKDVRLQQMEELRQVFKDIL